MILPTLFIKKAYPSESAGMPVKNYVYLVAMYTSSLSSMQL